MAQENRVHAGDDNLRIKAVGHAASIRQVGTIGRVRRAPKTLASVPDNEIHLPQINTTVVHQPDLGRDIELPTISSSAVVGPTLLATELASGLYGAGIALSRGAPVIHTVSASFGYGHYLPRELGVITSAIVMNHIGPTATVSAPQIHAEQVLPHIANGAALFIHAVGSELLPVPHIGPTSVLTAPQVDAVITVGLIATTIINAPVLAPAIAMPLLVATMVAHAITVTGLITKPVGQGSVGALRAVPRWARVEHRLSLAMTLTCRILTATGRRREWAHDRRTPRGLHQAGEEIGRPYRTFRHLRGGSPHCDRRT